MSSDKPFDLNIIIQEPINKRRHNKLMHKRRSRGIVSIKVNWIKVKLEMYNVILSDRKEELEPIKLEGKFPLTHIQKNVYEVSFDVPNGPPLRVVVRYQNNWVMYNAPGRSWNIYCQVGKVHD